MSSQSSSSLVELIKPMTDSFVSWIFFGTKVVGGLFLTISLLLYYNQDRMLYIPNPPGFPKTPNENPPGFTSPGDWSRLTGRPFNPSYTAND